MNAQEIVDDLRAGKTVAILADDAFVFMREVERHALASVAIAMTFENGQCVMRVDAAQKGEGS